MSKSRKKAFKKWKLEDPHPDRSFGSKHFKKAGQEFFAEVSIIPIGTLERFSKLLPINERQAKYRRWAYRIEKKLPREINLSLARSQTIILKKPKI